MTEIMIFKAGKYPQGDWPKERVQKLVDAYNPDVSEAPLVIGHRFFGNDDSYQDAHGWVQSLRMDGAGKVYAVITDVTADLKKKVAEKKLKYLSAEIFEQDRIDDQQPPYLRAVALLGRDIPAVRGAKLPTAFTFVGGGVQCFAQEDEKTTVFTSRVSADGIQEFSGKPETTVTLSRGGTMDELEKMKAEGEKLRADFAAQNTRLAALEQENAELRNAGTKAESEAFFGKLRDEGKITPAQFASCVSIDCKLEGDERKDYRALFAAAPAQVDLSGSHAAPKGRAPESRAETAGLTAKIKAFQKEKGLASFDDAAQALFAAKPELFDEGEAHD